MMGHGPWLFFDVVKNWIHLHCDVVVLVGVYVVCCLYLSSLVIWRVSTSFHRSSSLMVGAPVECFLGVCQVLP